jgi:hypothetical protein
VYEEAKRRSMEQVRAHLARADSELEAAQRLLDPRTDDEFENGLATITVLEGDAPYERGYHNE